jgi:hypothetical protein
LLPDLFGLIDATSNLKSVDCEVTGTETLASMASNAALNFIPAP